MESAADASAASAGSDQKAPSTRLGSGRADRSENLRKPSQIWRLLSSPHISLSCCSALLQRQCYGRLSPSVLHMESLAYQPIDYLTLDYCRYDAWTQRPTACGCGTMPRLSQCATCT